MENGIKHESIGRCINADGKIIELEKKYYRQGFIFKDWNAFYNAPGMPCYVPELSDRVYTREDFLQISDGQVEQANELFEEVDWQYPESLFDEWEADDKEENR